MVFKYIYFYKGSILLSCGVLRAPSSSRRVVIEWELKLYLNIVIDYLLISQLKQL